MPEGRTLDDLLTKTVILFQKKILEYIKSRESKSKNNNEESKEIKNNKDLPQGLQGVILALIWISKSLFMRPTASNFEKTFSWQENFSTFLYSLLTQPTLIVLKNSKLVKYVNIKDESFDLIMEENTKIGEFIGEKMSIIMTNNSYILPEKNVNFPLFYNNFSPFWKQRTWTRLAIPLLKKMVEINQINISVHNTTVNNNTNSDTNKNDDRNNSNDVSNNNNNKTNINININNNNSTDSTHATPCLLGLLNLAKNMPGNVLSSHSADLSRIIISALKINFDEFSVKKIDSGNVTDAYALSGEISFYNIM